MVRKLYWKAGNLPFHGISRGSAWRNSSVMIWKTENMPNELEALEKKVSRQNIYGVIYLFLAG